MRRILLLCGVVGAMMVGCDETSKACFEGGADKTIKNQVSACGELCEKKDAKGCDKQVELANAACIDNGDAEICDWMCNYATMGKDLYCTKHEELASKAKK